MTTRDDLLIALEHPNVRAFLRVIRAGESSQDDTAYRMVYGGELVESLQRHPRIPKQTPWGWTSAAGAYQFMAAIPGKVKTDTWDGLERKYGPLDFSPTTQDLMAVALIDRRGALVMVMEGRIREAIHRCAREWASLPGSPYGQPTISMDRALAIYHEYGGAFPHEEEQPQETQQEKPMAPIVIPLLQAAASLIPALGGLFGSGSEVANRNIAAGKVVADTLVQATQAINLQEAVERIQNDPRALQAARSAVADVLPSIMESGGGGIEGARKAAANADQPPFWRQPAFIFLLLALPLVYMLALSVLFGVGGVEWTVEVRVMVATGLIALLSGGTAFFWGSSLGSQKKDSMLGGRP